MHGELEKMVAGETSINLNEAQKKVIRRTRERKLVSSNAHDEFLKEASLGDRVADKIAAVGGSWYFIGGFIVFLIFWVSANTILLTQDKFDPYPFIFLNLILSMVAALQAPVIMMSQNRASARDRYMAAKDYEVNLKAELEVLGLHQKIDQLVLTELRSMQEHIRMLTEELKAMKPESR